MKRGTLLLAFALILTLTGFVNAAPFSIGEFFDDIDSSTMLLGSLFIIFFIFLNFVFSKFFRNDYKQPNKPLAGILAIIVSILITYGLHKLDFDIGDFFSGFGLSQNLLEILVPIILLGGAIYIIWKMKIHWFFLSFGGLFILVSIMEWVYERDMLLIIGITMMIIGIILWIMYRRRRRMGINHSGNYSGRGGGERFGGIRKKWKEGKERNIQRRELRKQIKEQIEDIDNEIRRVLERIEKNKKDLRRIPPGYPEASVLHQEKIRLRDMHYSLKKERELKEREFRKIR